MELQHRFGDRHLDIAAEEEDAFGQLLDVAHFLDGGLLEE